MRSIASLALAVLAALTITTPAIAEVHVSIADGRVSIVARDATAAEILTEWAKVGQTKVENLQALPRDRMTIEVRNASEQQALAIVLRRSGGYMASRRTDAAPDLSGFERILIVPIVVARAMPEPASVGTNAGRAAGNGGASPARAAGNESNPAAAAIPANASTASPDPTTQAQGMADGQREVAPPQSSGQAVDDPDGAAAAQLAVPAAADAVIPDPPSQISLKARRALETADPKNFKFPPPQVVVQPVTQPKRSGGQ